MFGRFLMLEDRRPIRIDADRIFFVASLSEDGQDGARLGLLAGGVSDDGTIPYVDVCGTVDEITVRVELYRQNLDPDKSWG